MEQVKKTKYKWKRWLNYQSIVQQVPYLLFLAALAVLYIYNGHNADKMIRRTTKAGNELKDLQSEYKSVTGDVLLRSRQSELVEAVKPLGLQQLATEPTVLVDSTKEE
ncbi:FtsL-like putative cell division protein [Flavisolibacter nicotianae]|uniref:FtsL-like putative cell division protein n=1 Tax=Flavisolibacter nicotianae TaxID=2364882 RepID=UPI001F09EFBA|nr:FtsL-like putative cell division protein [Flavisolibacter nicotianae]